VNFEELKNYLSTDALKIINKILNDNELNDIDKKNAFDIAWYLKNKSTHYYIHTESLIKLFFDVYMDKEIRNKSCFSKLLRIIKDEIQHAENPQYDNLIKDPSEYIKNQRNILFTKIYTVMIVAINIKYMNESDFFEIINKLL